MIRSKMKKKMKEFPVLQSTCGRRLMMKFQKNKKKRKRSESESESSGSHRRIIKEGDIVDISRLLSTERRNYLVTSNGDQVEVDLLKGKVLVIYFVSLSYNVGERENRMALARTYHQLQHQGRRFEVVFIATRDDGDRTLTLSELRRYKSRLSKDPQDRFIKFFSRMPWLAIPYSDKKSRQRLERQFGLSNHRVALPLLILLDTTGMVLSTNAASYFHLFGAEGFPFTLERIQYMRAQEVEASKRPSLQSLLASTDRAFVIKNTGEKVPISSLEGKVICLYFYEDGETDDELTKKLILAYQELRQRGENFEVVLVYIYSSRNICAYVNKDSFWECFKAMPWLALPFMDPNCEKVVRIFNYPIGLDVPGPNPAMVIIGPNGSYVEFYGADILVRYGIAAYPFTREQAAKREAEKLREVTLGSLLDPGVVLRRKDGSQVFVSDLAEKRVLLLLAEKLCFESSEFLGMLKRTHCLKKGTEDEFEVIYMCLSHKESSYHESVTEIPWFVHPFCKDPIYAQQILSRMFKIRPTSVCALFAFGEDGKLVGESSYVGSGVKNYLSVFPFVRDLEEETLEDMILAYKWYNQYYDDPDAYLERLGFEICY